MNVLVAGGAGYIGSHATKMLLDAGYSVTVVDNLYRGHRAAVDKRAEFVQLDLLDTKELTELLDASKIEAVMHFAALAYVGESVAQPLDYYENNTAGTVSLLQAMKKVGVNKLVFSSTCATYGEPEVVPIVETEKQSPVNPYGWSKLFVERVLLDYVATTPEFAFVAPRYFNVAGASSDASIGEDHRPESHLIPLILEVALGKREKITIYGDDYTTDDGTCIRDYIHVEDLCQAHLLGMEALQPGDAKVYNLGIGRGYSVLEVIEAVRRVTGHSIPAEMGQRRPGDPAALFANPARVKKELGFNPKHTEIEAIVESAWKWHQSHPNGYDED